MIAVAVVSSLAGHRTSALRRLPALALVALLLCLPAERLQAQAVDAAGAPADPAADSAAAPPPLAPIDTDALAGEAPIDPDAPLTPIPDIGVDWPDPATPLPPLAAMPEPDAGVDPAPAVDVATDGGDDLPPPIGRSDIGEDRVVVGADAPAQPVNSAAAMRYDVALEGFGAIADDRFRARFDGLSVLRLRQGDPANGAQLSRRIAEDRVLLDQLMRNDGYYDATLTSDVRRSGDRALVAFGAQPGPRYTYAAVALSGLSAAGDDEARRLARIFTIAVGQPIIADDLVAAQARLQSELVETGYPFATVGDEDIVIDHDSRSGVLVQPVSPGGRLRFGAIIAHDDGLLGARHMQRIARFTPGEWYRQSDVDDLRRALIATGLVASAALEPVAAPDGGTVDLSVTVAAAPLRTISGALGYGSGEGFRAEIGWEHRNLFPPEGALIVRAVAGTQEQLASVSFRRNNFRRRDHVLTVQLVASQIDRDAYDARSATLSARLERTSTLIYQKRWAWSVGPELIFSDERSVVTSQNALLRQIYYIAALPAVLTYDRSDSLLDPSRGFRLSGRLSPEISIRGQAFTYLRGQIDGSAYLPVSSRVVLAGRVRIGSIIGSGAQDIAPSRRYYAGGGSSVRGYGYQNIGSRNVLGDPVGGKSLFEAGAEARIRIGDFSVVPFLDAGNVYDGSLPGFDGLRVGAGIGVRYHTNFGPIRVDVGTPVNPQPGDSRIGVYVSLGQAF